MAEIFVSYAREDRECAKQLVELLEGEGFDIFWDRELFPGPSFRQVIAAELAAAKCVITLWSTTSVASDWVIDEAEQGQRRRILLSVRIDDVDPPLGLRQGQAADLRAWTGRRHEVEVELLIRGIRNLVGPRPPVEPPTGKGPPPPPDRVLEKPPPAVIATWQHGLARHPLAAPTLMMAVVFGVNVLQTAFDHLALPGLGAGAGYPVSEAFWWFERNLSFDGHDATNSVAYIGCSISYFFLFPLMALAVAFALARRRDPLAYRTLSLAVAIDYLVSLPFFLFMPVPERWFQPKTAAMLLSDKWSDALIEAIRPISGLDNSFPSFHVSLTVLIVTICYVFDVRLRTCVAALGATVVLATFVLGIHWVPDIIGGFCLGVVSVLLAVRWVDCGRVAALWNVPARIAARPDPDSAARSLA
jgi:membrane-associated phospholipid phosphatase